MIIIGFSVDENITLHILDPITLMDSSICEALWTCNDCRNCSSFLLKGKQKQIHVIHRNSISLMDPIFSQMEGFCVGVSAMHDVHQLLRLMEPMGATIC